MPPAGGPCFADHLVEVGEAGVLKDRSAAERRQPLGGDVQSLWVPVEPEHPEPGVGGEQGGGVPPGPDGRVEDDTRWDRGEEFHHLGGHDRLVYGIPVHPQPPDGRGAVREFPLATDGEEGGGGVFHRAGRGAAHVPGAMPFLLVVVASSVSLLSSPSQSSSSSRNHCSDGCTRFPDRRVPQLDPIDRPDHEHVGLQPGELPQPGHDRHASLPVDLYLLGVRRPEPGPVAIQPAGGRPLLHRGHLTFELPVASTRPDSPRGSRPGIRPARRRHGTSPAGSPCPSRSSECSYLPTNPDIRSNSHQPSPDRSSLPFKPLRTTLRPISPLVNTLRRDKLPLRLPHKASARAADDTRAAPIRARARTSRKSRGSRGPRGTKDARSRAPAFSPRSKVCPKGTIRRGPLAEADAAASVANIGRRTRRGRAFSPSLVPS